MTDAHWPQPAGWSHYCTILDDVAEHQIRVLYPGAWSCTCQRYTPTRGAEGHKPLGHIGGMTAEQILDAHRAHVEEATAASA